MTLKWYFNPSVILERVRSSYGKNSSNAEADVFTYVLLCVCVQEFERMRSNAVVSMCEHVANT